MVLIRWTTGFDPGSPRIALARGEVHVVCEDCFGDSYQTAETFEWRVTLGSE